MTLGEKITEAFTTAMKARQSDRVDALRMMRAALLELEKSGEEVTPEAEQKVIVKLAKTYRESIEGFEAGGRQDRAENNRRALAIVEEFLPKQLDSKEIESIARRIAEEVGPLQPNDFAKLMPRVIAETKGRADGRLVKEVVTNVLKGSDKT